MTQHLDIDGKAILHPKGDQLREIAGSDNPVFNNILLNGVVNATWYYPKDTPETRGNRATAALAAMKGFAPRDEVEGMMAAQAVALHLAAMECARRAMLPDQPGEAAVRLRKDAANLSRAMVDMAEAIDRRRGKAPQMVRVERVVVNQGGQAIVGAVNAATPQGPGHEKEFAGKPHAPRALEKRQSAGQPELGATLRSAEPAGAGLPGAGDG